MLYILDTDHISLLQRNAVYVIAHLKQISPAQRATTIISLTEQIQGRLASISRAKQEIEAGIGFQRLLETIEFYRPLAVLLYDQRAFAEFERLRQQKIRIGTQDLRIAAIALSQVATVATRNLRDFGQVPGLRLEDWSQPL